MKPFCDSVIRKSEAEGWRDQGQQPCIDPPSSLEEVEPHADVHGAWEAPAPAVHGDPFLMTNHTSANPGMQFWPSPSHTLPENHIPCGQGITLPSPAHPPHANSPTASSTSSSLAPYTVHSTQLPGHLLPSHFISS